MEEDKREEDESGEKEPDNDLEASTGYELQELAKAPVKPPEPKIEEPPKSGVGLVGALAIGLFFLAIIIGWAASWLAAALLLIIGAPLLGLMYTLFNRIKRR